VEWLRFAPSPLKEEVVVRTVGGGGVFLRSLSIKISTMKKRSYNRIQLNNTAALVGPAIELHLLE